MMENICTLAYQKAADAIDEIGRASCRERVCMFV